MAAASNILDTIAEARSTFLEAVRKARAAKYDLNEALVKQVLGEEAEKPPTPDESDFGRLVAAAQNGTLSESEIEDRAEQLARNRVLILPPASLRIEAESGLREMAEWNVPDTILANLTKAVTDVVIAPFDPKAGEYPSPAATVQARETTLDVLENYDYWDNYSEWFFAIMRVALWWMGGCFVALLISAFLLLHFRSVIVGFMLAGTAGTLVSIMLKMPPLSVYGQVASFSVRIVGRGAAGVAAVAIGCGLISSGVIPLAVHDKDGQTIPFATLTQSCAGECGGADDTKQPQRKSAAAATSSDGGESSDTGDSVADMGAAPAAKKLPQSQSSKGPCDRCPRHALFVLLAIAMLLGFSERGLASFEDAVFGAGQSGGKT